MKIKSIIAGLVLTAALSGQAVAQTLPAFKPGERVVFNGDSITEGGRYYSYIWLYYMTRFPGMDIWMANAGVGGDDVWHIIERMDGDVLDKQPTVLTVTFGMNDTGYFEYLGENPEAFGQKKLDYCKEGWEILEARLKELKDVKIILIGGTPYDEGAKFDNVCLTGKNSWILKVNDMLKASAQKNGWEWLDFGEPLMKVAAEQQAIDSTYTISRGDRIHPDNDNHMVMAYTFLKAQDFGGHAKVADFAVDATTATVTKSEHCNISNVKKTEHGASFDYLADALPYPLDTIAHDWDAWKSQADACKLIPLMEEMNSETISVSGLSEGNYHIIIDGVDVGIYSSEALAQGVNLASIEWTPQYRQALTVMHLNEYRYNIEQEFRHYSWLQYDYFKEHGLFMADDKRAIQAMDSDKAGNGWLRGYRQLYDGMMNKDVRDARTAEQNLLIEKIYQINKPVTRRIEVKKVNGGKDWAIGPFTRMQDTPVISPDASYTFECPMAVKTMAWMESDTFNPAAAIKDGKICVLFRAEDNSHQGIGSRTSRVGLAESRDGVSMKIRKAPVLFPCEDNQKEYDWEGGCEDPRVAKADDGTYVMLYTSWNRKCPRLCVATSKDLLTWEKHGPAFAKAYDGKFLDMACKSGSVVTSIKGGEMRITKIGGKYLMYWGESMINLATSDNLVDWWPMLDSEGNLLKVAEPRPGKFDSSLTECGPPAVLTKNGIVLMYNGKNSRDGEFDPNYTRGTYSAGQILFDANDPVKVIDRLDDPFFKPEADFEKSGQYPDGTVFIEGLVLHKKKWYLYYGCADSFVGVAKASRQ